MQNQVLRRGCILNYLSAAPELAPGLFAATSWDATDDELANARMPVGANDQQVNRMRLQVMRQGRFRSERSLVNLPDGGALLTVTLREQIRRKYHHDR